MSDVRGDDDPVTEPEQDWWSISAEDAAEVVAISELQLTAPDVDWDWVYDEHSGCPGDCERDHSSCTRKRWTEGDK